MRSNDRFGRLLGLPVFLFLATLCGCKTDPQGSASAAAQALAISGNPPAAVATGQTYQFQPTVSSALNVAYSFTVANKPRWATLNTVSGTLTGTPSSADVGSYAGIVVSVSTSGASAALAPFTIRVNPPGGGTGTPTIGGTPQTSVAAGTAYSFTPVAADPDGDHLAFSIQNKPSWATFNPASGALSGLPTSGQTGTYANILISVTDGKASASLPKFAIAVTAPGSGTGSATLSWVQPTTNTDGTPLINLGGYRIYYGNSANAMTQSITLTNTGTTNYVMSNLAAGTWYFAVKSYNSLGVESDLSEVVSKAI